MGADATHRPCPPDGQADVDVLAGPDEGPDRRPVVRTAVVVAVLLVAVAAVDPWPEPQAPVLALRDGELVPRDRSVDGRRAEAAMHVEVVNTGDRTLVVQSGALVPGSWGVDVVDRPLLVPGESLVLSLHRTVVCDEGASYGPVPEHLVLQARTSEGGEALEVRLPVGDRAAYDGALDDALRHPGRACLPGDDVGRPLGDLVGSWRARRSWPPVASR